MNRSLLLLLALSLLLVTGCKAGEGEECAKNEDCGSSLTCHNFECVSIQTLREIKEKRAKRSADRAHCNRYVPHVLGRTYGADENLCFDKGLCTVSTAGECVASNDSDCTASTGCKFHGACGYVFDGDWARCGPRTTKDCQASERCRIHGRCVLSQSKEIGHVSSGDVRCLPRDRGDAWKEYSIVVENPYWMKVE